MDLSHPTGASVNDGIELELCTLRYTSVDEAVKRIRAGGWRTPMAKLDVESAYCIILVHPTVRQTLIRDGMKRSAVPRFGAPVWPLIGAQEI